MQITLKLNGEKRKLKPRAKTIEELLKNLRINTESVIIKRNEKFVPVEDRLKDKDKIDVIRITSSG